MANKITQRETVTMMMADAYISQNEVFMGYLKHQLDVLDKKADARKSASESDENKALMNIVLDVLSTVDRATVSEIQTKNDTLGKLSNQKVSYLARTLRDAGLVTKTIDKKKPYFSIVKETSDSVEDVE